MKKKFLTKSFTFLTLTLFTTIGLNALYLQAVVPKKIIHRQESQWQEYRQKNQNTLDYAIFGDSHVRNGLAAPLIENSFNFATGGENYVETYYKIKKLLDEEVKIQAIIIPLDPHTFAPKIRKPSNLFQESDYYNRFVPLKEIAHLKEKNYLALSIQKAFPVLGNGKDFVYLFNPPNTSNIQQGWLSKSNNFNKQSVTEKQKTAESRVNFQISSLSQEQYLESQSYQHFLKIIDLAQKLNWQINIVSYPLTSQYLQALHKTDFDYQKQKEQILTTLEKKKIPYQYFDFSEEYSNQTDYFSDSDHLNIKGAKIFTTELRDSLQPF